MDHIKFLAQEQAYRLFIQEVVPDEQVRKNKNNDQITMVLRLSLPIIIKSQALTHQALIWKTHSLNKKEVELIAHNVGNNIVFINKIALYSKEQQSIDNPLHTFAYLLPGNKKKWIIHPKINKPPHIIHANVNQQMIVGHVS